ncbi:MAG: twin-arginine translocase subunit TatC [Duncaniella sp.]|nr:twin-arginine translocase subunit TatC [Duncaniella sp.]
MERSTKTSFWDHAEVLRGVLLRILAALGVLLALSFAVMPRLFDTVVLAPCHTDFPLYSLPGAGLSADVGLVNIRLASQFFIHMTASFYLALVLGLPVILLLLWGFVSPGLYPEERRGAAPALAGGCLMFYAGVAAGYFLVFPLTLRFLADYQLSALVPNQVSLDSYIETFFMTLLCMGLAFELPVVAWLLGRLGVLRRGMFNEYRRHAIVAILVAAAVITPSGDPFTLMVVFAPLYLLWEISAWLVPARRLELGVES